MTDPYLTPERFKTMGTGVDLSEVEDIALRSSIMRSVAAIHSYCAVPTMPQQYSYRGGTITGEEHIYQTDAWERPRPFRVWPWHTPVRTVVDLRLIWGIQQGNETFLDISPGNLLISDQGYLEVSSLNLSQLVFGDAIMPYIGLHDPIFRVGYTYGYRFTEVSEICDPVDARTYQAQNQFWTDDTVTVKVNGSTVTTGFTLDRLEGWILFGAMQAPDALVQVSYVHSLPNDIMQACAILTAKDLTASDIRAKGLEGLASISVKDVAVRRAMSARSSSGSGHSMSDIPDEAARYLNGWDFRTAR